MSLYWLRSVTPPSFSDLEVKNKVNSFQLMDTAGRGTQATILLLNVGKEKNTHIHGIPVRDRSISDSDCPLGSSVFLIIQVRMIYVLLL